MIIHKSPPVDWTPLRFGLRTLLLAMVGVAIVAIATRKVHRELVGNYEEFCQQIKFVNHIHSVHVTQIVQEPGIDVDALDFLIDGKPHSHVQIWSPDTDIFTSAHYIGLGVIGDMNVSVSYLDSHGESIGGGCADIGPHSDLKEILPFTVKNLEELIDRYDELEAYFRTWHDLAHAQVLEVSPTRKVMCYISK